MQLRRSIDTAGPKGVLPAVQTPKKTFKKPALSLPQLNSGYLAQDHHAKVEAEAARTSALELSLSPAIRAVETLTTKLPQGKAWGPAAAKMSARLTALTQNLDGAPPPKLAIALYELRRALGKAKPLPKTAAASVRSLTKQIDTLLGAKKTTRGLFAQTADFERVRNALGQRGIKYTVRMAEWGGFHTPELVLLPDADGSRLGKITDRVARTMDVEILYRPNQTRQRRAAAMYLPAHKQIAVDTNCLLNGEVTTTLLHEISHAKKHANRLSGRASLVDGWLGVTSGVLPGSKNAPVCYRRGMSLEELYTHTKDARRLATKPESGRSLVGKLQSVQTLSKMAVASLDKVVEGLDRALAPRVFGPIERLFSPSMKKGAKDGHIQKLSLMGRDGVKFDVPLVSKEAKGLWAKYRKASPFAKGKARRALLLHMHAEVTKQRALAESLFEDSSTLLDMDPKTVAKDGRPLLDAMASRVSNS